MKVYKVGLIGHSYVRDLKNLDISEICVDDKFKVEFKYIFKSGATISYFCTHNLDSLFAYKPDIVFIVLGGNDLRADLDIHDTIANYRLLVQRIVDNLPEAAIICSYIEPRFAEANSRFNTFDFCGYRALAKKFNNWLQKWDLPYRKFLTWGSNRFENKELFKADLIHLNSKGLHLFWELFEDLLLKTINSRFE